MYTPAIEEMIRVSEASRQAFHRARLASEAAILTSRAVTRACETAQNAYNAAFRASDDDVVRASEAAGRAYAAARQALLANGQAFDTVSLAFTEAHQVSQVELRTFLETTPEHQASEVVNRALDAASRACEDAHMSFRAAIQASNAAAAAFYVVRQSARQASEATLADLRERERAYTSALAELEKTKSEKAFKTYELSLTSSCKGDFLKHMRKYSC